MKFFIMMLSVIIAACATDFSSLEFADIDGKNIDKRLLYPYEPSQLCSGCHGDQYLQYKESMHAKSFTNPLFNMQYFNDIVPRALRDPGFNQEARRCVACHAPVIFMNYTGLVTTAEQANRFETGVTCDFCHTLAGYAENGDYKQNPSGKKQGPYTGGSASSHHSEQSTYVENGEFCGRCHNATNHVGLEVKSTYYEWSDSSYGQQGVSCQECHMNKNGFLKAGVAEFAKGSAAYINVAGVMKDQAEHEKLYNHSFPGAHSPNQLQDALLLEFKTASWTADAAGRFPFTIIVSNERTGHKMPSGSSDLRFMWLAVSAVGEDGTVLPVSLAGSGSTDRADDYSLAGASQDDAAILQNDVPKGSRIYRTVLVNAGRRQSLFQYDAVENIFDNRFDAGEIRKEGYYMAVPPGFSGKVQLQARLYYRGAPSSFAGRMKVPDFSPVLVAAQIKDVSIQSRHAQ